MADNRLEQICHVITNVIQFALGENEVQQSDTLCNMVERLKRVLRIDRYIIGIAYARHTLTHEYLIDENFELLYSYKHDVVNTIVDTITSQCGGTIDISPIESYKIPLARQGCPRDFKELFDVCIPTTDLVQCGNGLQVCGNKTKALYMKKIHIIKQIYALCGVTWTAGDKVLATVTASSVQLQEKIYPFCSIMDWCLFSLSVTELCSLLEHLRVFDQYVHDKYMKSASDAFGVPECHRDDMSFYSDVADTYGKELNRKPKFNPTKQQADKSTAYTYITLVRLSKTRRDSVGQKLQRKLQLPNQIPPLCLDEVVDFTQENVFIVQTGGGQYVLSKSIGELRDHAPDGVFMIYPVRVLHRTANSKNVVDDNNVYTVDLVEESVDNCEGNVLELPE